VTLLTTALFTGVGAFVVLSVLIIYRIVAGPTMPDRVIAVNVLGTNTVVIIALIAAATDNPGVLDIALVYALLNFLMSIAISKFTVERGGVM